MKRNISIYAPVLTYDSQISEEAKKKNSKYQTDNKDIEIVMFNNWANY